MMKMANANSTESKTLNKSVPGREAGNRKASVEFSLQTVITMLVVLVGGALILYFMYVYLYQGRISPLTDTLKDTISSVMDPYG